MKSFLKEYSWQREMLISVSAVLIFAFIGPFGTFHDLSFFMRLVFWAVAVLGCGAIFWSIVYFFDHFKIFKNSSKYFRYSFIVFLTTIPATVLIYYNNVFFREIAFPLEKLPWLWSTVFIIGITITSLHLFSNFGKSLSKRKEHKKEVAKIVIETDKDILRFMDRLPKKLGRKLISLSSHDHHVDVRTDKGVEMIYMKFSDALKELKNYPGLRIHRSHWVAFDAVDKVKQSGRKWVVKLKDGSELPISEKYKSDVDLVL
ncbi:MAG: LytTR family transcriptional regulator [Devosiaceae bacterium]|nr:LytTR family transcriptional regulator [Devosiaceae bacterium]